MYKKNVSAKLETNFTSKLQYRGSVLHRPRKRFYKKSATDNRRRLATWTVTHMNSNKEHLKLPKTSVHILCIAEHIYKTEELNEVAGALQYLHSTVTHMKSNKGHPKLQKKLLIFT